MLRLNLEKCRLLRWGEVTGLSKADGDQSHTRRVITNETLVVSVLQQIKMALEDLGRLAVLYEAPPVSNKTKITTSRANDISTLDEQSSAGSDIYSKIADTGNHGHFDPRERKHAKGLNHIFQLAEDAFIVTKDFKRLS